MDNNTFDHNSRSYTILISKPKIYISERDYTIEKKIVYPKSFDSDPVLYYLFHTKTSSSENNDLAIKVNKSKDKAKLKTIEVFHFNVGVSEIYHMKNNKQKKDQTNSTTRTWNL